MPVEPGSMDRDELIGWLLGEPGELPAELRAAMAATFATATTEELRALAGCVRRAERGEDVDGQPEELARAHGRRLVLEADIAEVRRGRA